MKYILLLLSSLIMNAVIAGELNQRTHIAPKVQAKTSKILARAYGQDGMRQNAVVYGSNTQSSGQNVEIGTSHSAKNAPREQNTVTGDITVICHHCYGH